MIALYIALYLFAGLAFVKIISKVNDGFLTGCGHLLAVLMWPVALTLFLGTVVDDTLKRWCE